MTVGERVEQVYQAERDHIYSYLLHFGVAPDQAQEFTQDSFLKLYQSMEKGTTIDNPKAWLYRVARNLAIRGHNQPEFDELDPNAPPPEPPPDPEQTLMERQSRTALLNAIHSLSPRQKHCLHLRAQGLQFHEIGEVVGISTSAASEFLRRALVRLKEAVHG